jgi:putative NADH-flavin reductase
MNLAVIGASRGTGKYVVEHAIDRGHHVTVLARDPSKIPLRPQLTVVHAVGTRAADARKVVEGQDVVICCLGPSPMKRGQLVVTAAARALVQAMSEHGVRRMLLMSAVGAGESAGALSVAMPLFKLVARGSYEAIYGDKNQAEEILRASDLDYTLVRVPRLTDAPATGRYRTGDGKAIGVKFAAIGRADLSRFILDEIEKPAWIRGAPSVWA